MEADSCPGILGYKDWVRVNDRFIVSRFSTGKYVGCPLAKKIEIRPMNTKEGKKMGERRGGGEGGRWAEREKI